MSPEQCSGDPGDLDTRTDVYSLGMMFYEILCDQLPYDLTDRAIEEALRVIREEQPKRPSTVTRVIRGDLETIALKSLNKVREVVYESAPPWVAISNAIWRMNPSRPVGPAWPITC